MGILILIHWFFCYFYRFDSVILGTSHRLHIVEMIKMKKWMHLYGICARLHFNSFELLMSWVEYCGLDSGVNYFHNCSSCQILHWYKIMLLNKWNSWMPTTPVELFTSCILTRFECVTSQLHVWLLTHCATVPYTLRVKKLRHYTYVDESQ